MSARPTHRYEVTVRWTGNTGSGTSDYRGYRRDHEVGGDGKPAIPGSSDPAFRGDAARWNPEELLVVALAQCHMLWYLHLCATGGVVVTDYTDTPAGTMVMDETGGGGQFTEVVLRPAVTVADPSMAEKAQALHEEIGALCFIARSVSFPVRHEPTVRAALVPTRPAGLAARRARTGAEPLLRFTRLRPGIRSRNGLSWNRMGPGAVSAA